MTQPLPTNVTEPQAPKRRRRIRLPRPSASPAWFGALVGALAAIIFLTVILGHFTETGLGFLLDIIITLLIGAVVVGIASLLSMGALAIAHRMPVYWAGLTLGALIAAIIIVGAGFGPAIALIVGTVPVIPLAVLGAAVGFTRQRGLGRFTSWLYLFVGLSLTVTMVFWLTNGGQADGSGAPVPAHGPPTVAAPDPSQPGDFRVHTLTYGSGTDKRRPEYGAAVTLQTETVDASQIVRGWTGWQGAGRTFFWGFDSEALPLNGRVWYPEGDGPFPLVLIVHGNHKASDFSDAGYEYLGELLASRGFIATSVDQNFMNGAWMGNLKQENPARAWLLLQHLSTWRTWNETEGHPFFGRVDMDRISLIGHSRGGEAVAIAAVYNHLERAPDNANLTFDFHFGIQSVIAISPVDQQHSPIGKPLELENINYLVVHGAHDSDVSTYVGLDQFRRVRFTDEDPWFKAGVLVHGANHGNFNTDWGYKDLPSLLSLWLNRKPLMNAADQQQVAKVYVAAFLEATLNGMPEYIPLFQDHRAAGSWLPPTTYLTQYAAAGAQTIAHFDEDLDITTATLQGATLQGEHLATWKEQYVEMNQAVHLAWESGGETASYTVTLPAGFRPAATGTLTFAMADARTAPDEPLDLTIQLVDRAGVSVERPLSQFGALQPPVKLKRFKLGPLEQMLIPAKPVIQTFSLPLSAFAEGGLDPAALQVIRFRFDGAPAGAILLDDIQLHP